MAATLGQVGLKDALYGQGAIGNGRNAAMAVLADMTTARSRPAADDR